MSKNRRHLEEGEIVDDKKKDDRGKKDEGPPTKKNKQDKDASITTKTGGAYIPPARLRMMQQQITDKSSEQYQRISWEALKKSINGLINKVNISNISLIVRELFQENIVRGRGILAQSILQAQNASPTFTKVYAALVAILNTRFPQNGELILRRLTLQFRRSYRRNRKEICLHSAQFIAHLMNQQVAHEIIGLQILTLLLENPSDDSVEVAIGFLKECGQKLMDVSPRGLAAVMERLRNILHEQELDKRVQYMIEVMFAIRKDGFKEHPAVEPELDLVEETDQFTHMLQLDDDGGGKGTENQLNVFRNDPDFIQNEENYKQIKKDILDESSEGSSSGSDSSSEDSSDDEAEDESEKTQEIEDRTETNLVALRRTIYLAIQSSLDFEECAHKLLKMEFDVKDYREICAMIIDCCSQQRTYEKFFGLLGARFCVLKKEFMEHFEILFAEQYDTIHRLETNKLRNVAKFFAHLLHSDALPWTVLQNISLSEDTTTSSSRIFIKILFQELVEYLGLPKLNQRLKDETLSPFFEGLFPRDNPKNTRFAINFFTSIGLGGITDELREHLKNAAQKMTEKMHAEQLERQLNSSSSDSSDEASDSSEEDKRKKKKKKKKKETKKRSKSKKKRKQKKNETSSSSSEKEVDSALDSRWQSDSDSSPERRMKSSVVSKIKHTSEAAERKGKSSDLDNAMESSKKHSNSVRASRAEDRKSKKKNKDSSKTSSDEDVRKQRALREKLLTFSNTVPNEHFKKAAKAETKDKKQRDLKNGKEKSFKRGRPDLKNHKRSSSNDSSPSSDSSEDSSSSSSDSEDSKKIGESSRKNGRQRDKSSSEREPRRTKETTSSSKDKAESRRRGNSPPGRNSDVTDKKKYYKEHSRPQKERSGGGDHGRSRKRRSRSSGR